MGDEKRQVECAHKISVGFFPSSVSAKEEVNVRPFDKCIRKFDLVWNESTCFTGFNYKYCKVTCLQNG